MPAADGAFVSLAQLLRPQAASESIVPPVAAPVTEPAPPLDVVELARDVRVFRARLADAFDTACDALLREFAYAVLGRELILAPPEIAAIAARVLGEHSGTQPLRLRVAPSDALTLARIADALPPITSDAELAPGDVVLELGNGSIDVRLGIRLAALLEQPA